MTSRVIPVEPFTLVVFGATGDLSFRKLMPAMFRRDAAGQLPEAAGILGVGRAHLSAEQFVARVSAALEQHVPEAERPVPIVERFLQRLRYLAVDAAGDEGWVDLREELRAVKDRVSVFYLATAPTL